MKIWLRQHAFALTNSVRQAIKTPGNFIMNVTVIAIALSLPFAGLTLLENARPVSEQLAVDPEISIFLAMGLKREHALALAPQIQRLASFTNGGTKLDFVARENALSALKDKTGLADALATLGSNPLPDAYILKLAGFHAASDAAQIGAMVEQIKTLPGVESVQIDSDWVKRLAALLRLFRLALLLLALTLGIVVITVVFNTIRLQVMTQRHEIEVSRLVGATDAFIYRPFYYAGTLLGLCAGALSLAAIGLGLLPLNTAIAELAQLYASNFTLAALSLPTTGLLLVISGLLGWSGAVFSVRRYLANSA